MATFPNYFRQGESETTQNSIDPTHSFTSTLHSDEASFGSSRPVRLGSTYEDTSSQLSTFKSGRLLPSPRVQSGSISGHVTSNTSSLSNPSHPPHRHTVSSPMTAPQHQHTRALSQSWLPPSSSSTRLTSGPVTVQSAGLTFRSYDHIITHPPSNKADDGVLSPPLLSNVVDGFRAFSPRVGRPPLPPTSTLINIYPYASMYSPFQHIQQDSLDRAGYRQHDELINTDNIHPTHVRTRSQPLLTPNNTLHHPSSSILFTPTPPPTTPRTPSFQLGPQWVVSTPYMASTAPTPSPSNQQDTLAYSHTGSRGYQYPDHVFPSPDMKHTASKQGAAHFPEEHDKSSKRQDDKIRDSLGTAAIHNVNPESIDPRLGKPHDRKQVLVPKQTSGTQSTISVSHPLPLSSQSSAFTNANLNIRQDKEVLAMLNLLWVTFLNNSQSSKRRLIEQLLQNGTELNIDMENLESVDILSLPSANVTQAMITWQDYEYSYLRFCRALLPPSAIDIVQLGQILALSRIDQLNLSHQPGVTVHVALSYETFLASMYQVLTKWKPAMKTHTFLEFLITVYFRITKPVEVEVIGEESKEADVGVAMNSSQEDEEEEHWLKEKNIIGNGDGRELTTDEKDNEVEDNEGSANDGDLPQGEEEDINKGPLTENIDSYGGGGAGAGGTSRRSRRRLGKLDMQTNNGDIDELIHGGPRENSYHTRTTSSISICLSTLSESNSQPRSTSPSLSSPSVGATTMIGTNSISDQATPESGSEVISKRRRSSILDKQKRAEAWSARMESLRKKRSEKWQEKVSVAGKTLWRQFGTKPDCFFVLRDIDDIDCAENVTPTLIFFILGLARRISMGVLERAKAKTRGTGKNSVIETQKIGLTFHHHQHQHQHHHNNPQHQLLSQLNPQQQQQQQQQGNLLSPSNPQVSQLYHSEAISSQQTLQYHHGSQESHQLGSGSGGITSLTQVPEGRRMDVDSQMELPSGMVEQAALRPSHESPISINLTTDQLQSQALLLLLIHTASLLRKLQSGLRKPSSNNSEQSLHPHSVIFSQTHAIGTSTAHALQTAHHDLASHKLTDPSTRIGTKFQKPILSSLRARINHYKMQLSACRSLTQVLTETLNASELKYEVTTQVIKSMLDSVEAAISKRSSQLLDSAPSESSSYRVDVPRHNYDVRNMKDIHYNVHDPHSTGPITNGLDDNLSIILQNAIPHYLTQLEQLLSIYYQKADDIAKEYLSTIDYHTSNPLKYSQDTPLSQRLSQDRSNRASASNSINPDLPFDVEEKDKEDPTIRNSFQTLNCSHPHNNTDLNENKTIRDLSPTTPIHLGAEPEKFDHITEDPLITLDDGCLDAYFDELELASMGIAVKAAELNGSDIPQGSDRDKWTLSSQYLNRCVSSTFRTDREYEEFVQYFHHHQQFYFASFDDQDPSTTSSHERFPDFRTPLPQTLTHIPRAPPLHTIGQSTPHHTSSSFPSSVTTYTSLGVVIGYDVDVNDDEALLASIGISIPFAESIRQHCIELEKSHIKWSSHHDTMMNIAHRPVPENPNSETSRLCPTPETLQTLHSSLLSWYSPSSNVDHPQIPESSVSNQSILTLQDGRSCIIASLRSLSLLHPLYDNLCCELAKSLAYSNNHAGSKSSNSWSPISWPLRDIFPSFISSSSCGSNLESTLLVKHVLLCRKIARISVAMLRLHIRAQRRRREAMMRKRLMKHIIGRLTHVSPSHATTRTSEKGNPLLLFQNARSMDLHDDILPELLDYIRENTKAMPKDTKNKNQKDPILHALDLLQKYLTKRSVVNSSSERKMLMVTDQASSSYVSTSVSIDNTSGNHTLVPVDVPGTTQLEVADGVHAIVHSSGTFSLQVDLGELSSSAQYPPQIPMDSREEKGETTQVIDNFTRALLKRLLPESLDESVDLGNRRNEESQMRIPGVGLLKDLKVRSFAEEMQISDISNQIRDDYINAQKLQKAQKMTSDSEKNEPSVFEQAKKDIIQPWFVIEDVSEDATKGSGVYLVKRRVNRKDIVSSDTCSSDSNKSHPVASISSKVTAVMIQGQLLTIEEVKRMSSMSTANIPLNPSTRSSHHAQVVIPQTIDWEHILSLAKRSNLEEKETILAPKSLFTQQPSYIWSLSWRKKSIVTKTKSKSNPLDRTIEEAETVANDDDPTIRTQDTNYTTTDDMVVLSQIGIDPTVTAMTDQLAGYLLRAAQGWYRDGRSVEKPDTSLNPIPSNPTNNDLPTSSETTTQSDPLQEQQEGENIAKSVVVFDKRHSTSTTAQQIHMEIVNQESKEVPKIVSKCKSGKSSPKPNQCNSISEVTRSITTHLRSTALTQAQRELHETIPHIHPLARIKPVPYYVVRDPTLVTLGKERSKRDEESSTTTISGNSKMAHSTSSTTTYPSVDEDVIPDYKLVSSVNGRRLGYFPMETCAGPKLSKPIQLNDVDLKQPHKENANSDTTNKTHALSIGRPPSPAEAYQLRHHNVDRQSGRILTGLDIQIPSIPKTPTAKLSSESTTQSPQRIPSSHNLRSSSHHHIEDKSTTMTTPYLTGTPFKGSLVDRNGGLREISTKNSVNLVGDIKDNISHNDITKTPDPFSDKDVDREDRRMLLLKEALLPRARFHINAIAYTSVHDSTLLRSMPNTTTVSETLRRPVTTEPHFNQGNSHRHVTPISKSKPGLQTKSLQTTADLLSHPTRMDVPYTTRDLKASGTPLKSSACSTNAICPQEPNHGCKPKFTQHRRVGLARERVQTLRRLGVLNMPTQEEKEREAVERALRGEEIDAPALTPSRHALTRKPPRIPPLGQSTLFHPGRASGPNRYMLKDQQELPSFHSPDNEFDIDPSRQTNLATSQMYEIPSPVITNDMNSVKGSESDIKPTVPASSSLPEMVAALAKTRVEMRLDIIKQGAGYNTSSTVDTTPLIPVATGKVNEDELRRRLYPTGDDYLHDIIGPGDFVTDVDDVDDSAYIVSRKETEKLFTKIPEQSDVLSNVEKSTVYGTGLDVRRSRINEVAAIRSNSGIQDHSIYRVDRNLKLSRKLESQGVPNIVDELWLHHNRRKEENENNVSGKNGPNPNFNTLDTILSYNNDPLAQNAPSSLVPTCPNMNNGQMFTPILQSISYTRSGYKSKTCEMSGRSKQIQAAPRSQGGKRNGSTSSWDAHLATASGSRPSTRSRRIDSANLDQQTLSHAYIFHQDPTRPHPLSLMTGIREGLIKDTIESTLTKVEAIVSGGHKDVTDADSKADSHCSASTVTSLHAKNSEDSINSSVGPNINRNGLSSERLAFLAHLVRNNYTMPHIRK